MRFTHKVLAGNPLALGNGVSLRQMRIPYCGDLSPSTTSECTHKHSDGGKCKDPSDALVAYEIEHNVTTVFAGEDDASTYPYRPLDR